MAPGQGYAISASLQDLTGYQVNSGRQAANPPPVTPPGQGYALSHRPSGPARLPGYRRSTTCCSWARLRYRLFDCTTYTYFDWSGVFIFYTNPLSMRTFVRYMYCALHSTVYIHAEHINCI